MKRGPKPIPITVHLETAEVTAVQMSSVVMLSPKRIEQLVVEGFITKLDTGKFILADVVHGILRYEREVAKPSTKSAAAAEVQNTRAEEIRIRIDERKQRLLREAQTEAIDIVSEYGGGLRADMLSIPPKVCPELKQRSRLAEAIDLAFGAAARRAATSANLVADAGERLGAAGAVERKRVGRKKSIISGQRRSAGAAQS